MVSMARVPEEPEEREDTNVSSHYAMGEVRVPNGKYWVMGDNRNDSNDSHQWGFLDGDRIVGRAEAIFWPIRRIQLIRNH